MNSKLSMEKAREIREKAAQGVAEADLALEYGVKVQSIQNVVSHVSWQEGGQAHHKDDVRLRPGITAQFLSESGEFLLENLELAGREDVLGTALRMLARARRIIAA